MDRNYSKETFEEMIRDWKADNAPEYDNLEITSIEFVDGEYVATAEDEKSTYSLMDVSGNIVINYLGTK
jgi:hypothetical protein